ncbi:hypothetical protein AB0M28_13535 [Streptomyces sp. NPDC051940]|uniref:hypothetical protein n=1 Tax=Streptomyces sp. NPDC051940 TaxID=3155675 RepID=UPI003427176B
MHHRRTIIITASAAIAAALIWLAIWLSQPSYDDIVRDCLKALDAQDAAGTKGKPDACSDVKEDDYVALIVSRTFKKMPVEDQKLLDYYDDGSINDSIGN